MGVRSLILAAWHFYPHLSTSHHYVEALNGCITTQIKIYTSAVTIGRVNCMSRKKLHVSAMTPMCDLPNDPSYFHTSKFPYKEHKNHKNTSSRKQEGEEAVTERNAIDEEVI